MNEPVAILPEPGSPLGWQSWAREMAAAVRDTIDPPDYPSEPLPHGEGRTVLLVPGFLAGDWAMARLKGFLGSLDYRVALAGIPFNAGPTAAILARLDATLARLTRNGPIDLVGESLGGVLVRDLAMRHPDAVRRVVTLCAPVRFPVVTPLVPFVRLLAPFHDAAWVARRHDIAGPLPVPLTAIHSRDDGILDWRQCLVDEAPGQRNVCVPGAHTTMGSNPQAQRIIAEALARR